MSHVLVLRAKLSSNTYSVQAVLAAEEQEQTKLRWWLEGYVSSMAWVLGWLRLEADVERVWRAAAFRSGNRSSGTWQWRPSLLGTPHMIPNPSLPSKWNISKTIAMDPLLPTFLWSEHVTWLSQLPEGQNEDWRVRSRADAREGAVKGRAGPEEQQRVRKTNAPYSVSKSQKPRSLSQTSLSSNLDQDIKWLAQMMYEILNSVLRTLLAIKVHWMTKSQT